MMDEIRKSVQMRLRFEAKEDERAVFVNHATANFDGSTYTLRFYQVLPPPLLPENDLPEEIKGNHMVTLAISAGNMPAILRVLQSLIEEERS